MTPTTAPCFFGFLLTCLFYRSSSSQSGELTAVRPRLPGAPPSCPRRVWQHTHQSYTLSPSLLLYFALYFGRGGRSLDDQPKTDLSVNLDCLRVGDT
ncbi:unnamed protein product [Tetraodon nigroviridis]|uniref:(spotted green pufferfish) hypothetical protein n=1 Tax=Tetraodon nigroviridis TaxID=99883 RepID=Q4RQT1_TETNG|nr:unnamed protein product [Tetraodon nigroviridis]